MKKRQPQAPAKLDHHFRMSKQAKRLLAGSSKAMRGHLRRILISAELHAKNSQRFVMAHSVPKPRGYEGI